MVMGRHCIGVDVGGTTVKIGIFETDGTLLKKWEVPTRKEEGGKYIMEDVAASIRKTIEEMGIKMEDVLGAGLGVPGPVMPDGYVEVCVNLGWRNVNPQRTLSRFLDGLPVKSGNDANVAALGEMWMGGGKGYTDIVMVTLGTGVGGGVIVDEKIICGKHGMGGEIGHIRIREDEKEYCNCGGKGCLEQVASATGIAREARRAMKKSDEPSAMRAFGDEITAKDVLDCAKAGDRMALQVFDTVCYYLGWTLAQIFMTVDPQMFVIGGGVSRAGQFLLDGIEPDGSISESARNQVEELLKRSFRPEFLNRLDEIVYYKPLTKENVTAIVDLLLDSLNRRLADKQLKVELTPAAKTYVIDNGYDPLYGARPLRRFLQHTVETLISRKLIADEVLPDTTLVVDCQGDQLVVR